MKWISVRGYPGAEVSMRLGGGSQSIWEPKRKLSKPRGKNIDDGEDAEICRLRKELTRVTGECDIQKSDRAFRQGCKMR